MSLDEHELTPDEVLEVRTGTRIPFTQVGDWVLLARISPQAKLLYALLLAHVNVASGDRRVWPSLETLAELMGLANARSVSRYVDELVEIRAIQKIQQRGSNRMRTRNAYIVNGEPPAGIATPVRFADYYRARNLKDETPGQSVVTQKALRPDQARREPAGRAVVTHSALRTANDLHPVVTRSAPEQDQEKEKDQEGGARASEPAAPERTPDGDGPPTLKADWRKPETWLCGEHLVLLAADPGADRPACAKCGRVRVWAERKVAEDALSHADEAADEAERERLCEWHDAGGWVRLTGEDERDLPAVKCDHRTPPAEVRAKLLAAVAVPVGELAAEGRELAYQIRGCSRPNRAPAPRARRPRRQFVQDGPALDPASTAAS